MANPRKFSEKIALLNQKEAQETAAFEAIMREVSDVTSRTALSNLEEIQHNSMINRNSERGRHMGIGPVRSRPMEKRHDSSPYSGVSYLPLPDTWRRTNSDSALHQSANEACQSTTTIPHRRDQHNFNSSSSNDNRETHYGSIERPRSSCEMPRVPGINICLSSQPPGQQIPIGNNTGSLPDLSNVHFPSPLHTPLDQEDQSSSSLFSKNHLSVPVNSRFLHPFKDVALENSTSTSQQNLQNYSQQTAPQPPPSISHSPAGHYIYQQQPHSPVPPQSPKTSQSQQSQQQQQHQHQQSQQLNSLDSYRISQTVNRPSPQSSPSLTVQGSPLSYSNNPSAPPSPTGHPGPPTLASDGIDQNNYVINQAQAAALQQDFEQFTMDWPKFAQQLMELGCTWTTQIEMDTPVTANTIGSYIGSPNHTTSYAQNDMINVGGELGSGDGGYFSTSPQVAFQPTNTSTTTAQQLTPQTPNTPTIILTDFSGADDLTNPEFVKDLGTAMMSDFDPELFPTDDALRQGLGQIDVDGLQMLTDPTVVISDPSAEAHFRLDRL
ncbi:CREB-regulated transcription coactivator 1-like isoform X14 [Vespa mandarinia]|uniref:CREB-regulated transcription coactivator 1-like isoform X14 n=1 Tax=Vespa mandarinia TaxID=7446 RepID=UPI00160C1515|nr:CREB-regulated transcription coactivator 1-like isoform X14 [Vespa mandarinia]